MSLFNGVDHGKGVRRVGNLRRLNHAPGKFFPVGGLTKDFINHTGPSFAVHVGRTASRRDARRSGLRILFGDRMAAKANVATAATEVEAGEEAPAEKKKLPLKLIIIAAAGLLVVAGGGGAYFLLSGNQ